MIACDFIQFSFLKLKFQAHQASCPSRGLNFDRDMYSVGRNSRAQPAQPAQPPPYGAWDHVSVAHSVASFKLIPFNWFRPVRNSFSVGYFFIFRFQEDAETYDPRQYAMSANVLRHPVGLTPSERRQFADAERRRLSELNRSRLGPNNPR